MAVRTGEKTEVLRARVEPELVAAVERLREQNNVASQGEMVRLLIREGVKSVLEIPRPTGPALPRIEYANQAEVLMNALSDLIVRIELHDPAGAQLLAEAVAKSSTAYARELKRKHKR